MLINLFEEENQINSLIVGTYITVQELELRYYTASLKFAYELKVSEAKCTSYVTNSFIILALKIVSSELYKIM